MFRGRLEEMPQCLGPNVRLSIRSLETEEWVLVRKEDGQESVFIRKCTIWPQIRPGRERYTTQLKLSSHVAPF